MPEAAVHENHRMVFRKNDIRFAGISAVILAIPVSFREQILSDDFLRSGVLSSYMRHIEMPLFLRQNVRHRLHLRMSHFPEYLLEDKLCHHFVKLLRRVFRFNQCPEFDVALLTMI